MAMASGLKGTVDVLKTGKFNLKPQGFKHNSQNGAFLITLSLSLSPSVRC
jgi:hypothetical protein